MTPKSPKGDFQVISNCKRLFDFNEQPLVFLFLLSSLDDLKSFISLNIVFRNISGNHR
jgi:hypothetical protein